MEKAKKIKLFIGLFYLILVIVFLYLFFSKFSIQEITSYEFIKENRLYFVELRSSNLFLVFVIFVLHQIHKQKIHKRLEIVHRDIEYLVFLYHKHTLRVKS